MNVLTNKSSFAEKKMQKINNFEIGSNTNCRFNKWFMNTFKTNLIKFKKLAAIVSGGKNVTRLFVSQKQVSTNVGKSQLRTKSSITFLWPDASVSSFLHLMLIWKMLINQINNFHHFDWKKRSFWGLRSQSFTLLYLKEIIFNSKFVLCLKGNIHIFKSRRLYLFNQSRKLRFFL